MKFNTTIKIEALMQPIADKKAKSLEIIGNNISQEALDVLVESSKNEGMSDKVIEYQEMLKNM